MGADPVHRGAARTAALVALPVAVLAGLLSFWLLGGVGSRQATPDASATSARPQATSAVAVAAPALPAASAAVCRAVVAKLPEAVRDARRRPVIAGAEQNAAYGDPPLTLACGAPAQPYAGTDEVWTLSDVCWLARPEAGRTVWTTLDRRVPVAVTVPGPKDGSAQWVIAFSDAVGTADPPIAQPPRRCG